MSSSLRDLRRAANAGDADPQYQLAAMTATGDGCKKDVTEAARLYTEAADQGHPEAMYNLALMHLLGEVAGGTRKLAFALLARAAAGGSWDAQFYQFQIFSRGLHGMTKDRNKAAHYAVQMLRCGSNRAMRLVTKSLQARQLSSAALANALVSAAAEKKPRGTLAITNVRRSGSAQRSID